MGEGVWSECALSEGVWSGGVALSEGVWSECALSDDV